MQTPGKSSRKHGQDANLSRVFERTRSRCKPQERLRENTVRMQTDDLPPNRFTVFSNISWQSYPCFYVYFGPWKLNPRTSTLEFYACFLGDFFRGSIFGVPGGKPPSMPAFWAYCCIPHVFLRVFCKSASEGSSGEGGWER